MALKICSLRKGRTKYVPNKLCVILCWFHVIMHIGVYHVYICQHLCTYALMCQAVHPALRLYAVLWHISNKIFWSAVSWLTDVPTKCRSHSGKFVHVHMHGWVYVWSVCVCGGVCVCEKYKVCVLCSNTFKWHALTFRGKQAEDKRLNLFSSAMRAKPILECGASRPYFGVRCKQTQGQGKGSSHANWLNWTAGRTHVLRATEKRGVGTDIRGRGMKRGGM